MSNHLAIATVTAALRARLQSLVDAKVGSTQVIAGRPATGTEANAVYLYLFEVAANPALRNDDLPTRDGAGVVRIRPQIALDLSYLITATSTEDDVAAHRLIGLIASHLHTSPLLTAGDIANLLGGLTADHFLQETDLADAAELVRLTPMALPLEDLTRLWSSFHSTPFAPSLAWRASAVRIEAELTPAAPLPVRVVGMTAVPRAPLRLDAASDSAGPTAPITIGSTLRLRGAGFAAGPVSVRFGRALVAASPSSDGEILLPMSAVVAVEPGLRAGWHGVQVVRAGVSSAASDTLGVALRPTVTAPAGVIVAAADPDEGTQHTITVAVNPAADAEQAVSLVLNRLGGSEGVDLAAEADTVASTVTLRVAALPAGPWLVRVRVDGAESVLVAGAGGYESPVVELG